MNFDKLRHSAFDLAMLVIFGGELLAILVIFGWELFRFVLMVLGI